MSENSESDDNEMQVFMFLVYMCTIGKSRDYIASATFGFFFLNVCETQFISMLYTAWEIESWYKCCLEIDEIEIKSIKDTITFMGMGDLLRNLEMFKKYIGMRCETNQSQFGAWYNNFSISL